MTEFETQMLSMMQDLMTKFGSLENKVDSLENKVDSLENKVDSLENKVDSLETRMDSMENKLTALDAKVDAGFAELRRMDDTLLDGIATLAKNQKEFQTITNEKIEAIEAVVSGLVFDVAMLKKKVG